MANIHNTFNININKNFIINNFSINTPLNIIVNDNYLSIHSYFNLVDFYGVDDNSGRQKWIIEKEDNETYYIKSVFNREDKNQYLGCPNKSNNVFLYTSKNRFTKWSIKNIEGNLYEIIYIGDKLL
jgi:hypothetical protein